MSKSQYDKKKEKYGMEWIQNNQIRHREKYKETIFKNEHHGMSIQEYQERLVQQDSLCAICRDPVRGAMRAKSVKQELCVDHCHTTGKIRGLLCFKCNAGLGMFADNIDYLTSAISYLMEYRT